MNRIGPVCVKLIDAAAYAVTTNVDVTDKMKKAQWVTPPTLLLVAVENSGSATCDVDVQTCLDGTNYEEVLSFTQLSASGHELKACTIAPWGPAVRVVVTLSTTGNWSITLYAAGQAMGASGA